MNYSKKTGITPTREENYSKWYQNTIKAGDLAENSPVRGCMIIKPWGYALWENIVNRLDMMFKKTGVKNAYFPIFIPLSFMTKEAEHIDGFAKECAIVTHHRLAKDEFGVLKPCGALSEPLIIRPTSETIIGDAFSKWIKSYRDLPMLINQWSNVVRWEMRTRMFLRTSEFLWQEGHTAHATHEEALERSKMMLGIYKKMMEKYLAIPVISGEKSKIERFPGAVNTFCIEAMMQDKKALQVGTSHFLGQNFSRTFNIKFHTKDEVESFVWTTSWGVSTRLIGGVIMVHGDDDGIIMPPRIAPSHVVILPIIKESSGKERVTKYVAEFLEKLRKVVYYDRFLSVEVDDRNIGGVRNWDWIRKGVPIRVEIGLKDIVKNMVSVSRRDKKHNDKISFSIDEFIVKIPLILDDIHNNIFKRAKDFKEKNTFCINNKSDFYAFFDSCNNGGFAISGWCGKKECEIKIKNKLSVTVRCIFPLKTKKRIICINCGDYCNNEAVFAKAY